MATTRNPFFFAPNIGQSLGPGMGTVGQNPVGMSNMSQPNGWPMAGGPLSGGSQLVGQYGQAMPSFTGPAGQSASDLMQPIGGPASGGPQNWFQQIGQAMPSFTGPAGASASDLMQPMGGQGSALTSALAMFMGGQGLGGKGGPIGGG